MKSLRIYLIALLSLLVIGIGALAYSQYNELTDLQAKLLDGNGSDLKKQLADARKQIKDLQDKLSTLRKHRGGPGEDQADEGGPAGGDDRAGRRGRDGGFGGPWGELMNRPDVQKLMALQQKANLDPRYAALFKSLNLTPEQLDAFKGLLVQKQQAVADAAQAARQSGIDPRQDPAAFKTAITEAESTVDAQIQASLGDAGYAQYQQYQQTLPERNTATALQTALSYTQTPLTDDQVNQMIGLLQQTQPTKAGSGTAGTGGGGGGMGALMNGGGQSAVTNDTLTLASSVLSAPQQAALQQIQAQQQAQQQMQQLMRQQRQAAAAGAAPAAGSGK